MNSVVELRRTLEREHDNDVTGLRPGKRRIEGLDFLIVVLDLVFTRAAAK